MKYIEPPTKRRPKEPIPPQKPGGSWVMRLIFALVGLSIILAIIDIMK